MKAMASKFIVSSPRILRSASGRPPPSVLRTNSVLVTSLPVLSSPSAPALRSSFSRIFTIRNQENESDNEFCHKLYYNAIRQILGQPSFQSLKGDLIQGLVQHLKHFSGKDPTVDTGLGIAASIDFLKMFNESKPELDDIRRRALEGAMSLKKGDVHKGKEKLKTTRDDIPKHI
ncbi:hypothetical protein F0562_015423 [Nyssa sinensis]|uniref:Uncharacterized protein n=1 Tax=Nyssa sinensis TaxID=561372 RepID=A0A5J4ZIQ4_9ASTE|nr:hypothetical protein F0562_015423 [Nyssa sinensis]